MMFLGDEISESLANAIEASAVSVIVFSEGYASSRWCLDELVKILDCKKEYAQLVIPVFYRVDPSDVRNQTGSFGDSFSKLEERLKENTEKLRSWRKALKEAARIWGIGGIGKTTIARATFDKISSHFEVKYLRWHGYPLKSFPSNLSAEKLMLLEVPDSDIEQLWDCVKHYSKLNQIIHAACHKRIAKIPNPTLMPRLNKLVTLNLRGSKSLKSLPSGIFNLEFLTKLDLSGCSKLKRLPEISSGNISWLFFRGTAIEELPSSIERLLREHCIPEAAITLPTKLPISTVGFLTTSSKKSNISCISESHSS
ncbi:hypothetical protein WN944_015532 [Citrus x changshan-huyou]|uniref:TIR domain-containing protein n=1 Tax=Citrus x changshan-huyou TaxID=2935761 RepID=A0AAP0MCP1_9ROSI